MKITPLNKPGSSRTGTLQNITHAEISTILGFSPNVLDDPYKVKFSWGFKVDDKEFGIWDYKGSHKWNQFSTYGPHEIFTTIFGDKYSNK